jgi:hypothetical protein
VLRVANYERGPTPHYPRHAIPRGLAASHVLVEIRHAGEIVSLRETGLPNPFLVPADGLIGPVAVRGHSTHLQPPVFTRLWRQGAHFVTERESA